MKQFAMRVLSAAFAFFCISNTAFAQTNGVSAYPPALPAIGLGVLLFLIIGFFVRVSRTERLVFLNYKAQKMLKWAPSVIGIASGTVFINAALERVLFLSQFPIQDGLFGTALVCIELGVGLFLILGLFTRIAALAILFLFVAASVRFGFSIVSLIPFLGVAFFVLLLGRGRYSLGSVFHNIFLSIEVEPLTHIAFTTLRIVTGVSFVLFGLQKILHPEAQNFLPSVFSMFHLSFVSFAWTVFAGALYEMFFGVLLAAHVRVRFSSIALLMLCIVSLFAQGSASPVALFSLAVTLAVFAVIGTREIVA